VNFELFLENRETQKKQKCKNDHNLASFKDHASLTTDYQISGVFFTNCAKSANKKRHHWSILVIKLVCFGLKTPYLKMTIFGTVPV
jgi:hypothetical protein